MVRYKFDMLRFMSELAEAINISGLRRNFICGYIGSHKDRLENCLSGVSRLRMEEGMVLCRLFGINPMDYIMKTGDKDVYKRQNGGKNAVNDDEGDSVMVQSGSDSRCSEKE